MAWKKVKTTKSTTRTSMYDNITDKVIKQLEAGTVPWQKTWIGGARNMPRNAVTNRAYRGMNIWTLLAESADKNYTSNQWLTFKQASELALGRNNFHDNNGHSGDTETCVPCVNQFGDRTMGGVRRGEKGTQVIFWKPTSYNKENDRGEMEQHDTLLLRFYYVWNVEQCDNIRIPDHAADKRTSWKNNDPIQVAEDIVVGYSDAPPIAWGFPHACYYPSQDRMEMPEMKQFNTSADYYTTLFHEFTHSTMHESRLNRKAEEDAGTHRFGSKPYGKEELVAEMGATYLMAFAGLTEQTFENNAAYLNSWIRTIKGDPKMVIHAAAQAQRSCDYILGDGADAEDEEADEG